MASQQVERTAELQDPKVRVELDWRIHRVRARVFRRRPVHFRRRVRMQGNRPCASRLGASGAGAERERCTGAAAKRGGPAGGYAGVPTLFLQHTCMSRGGLAREQKDPEVREGVGIANPSSSIVSFHKSTTSSSSYSSSIVRARPQHLKKAREPSYRASSIPVCRNIVAVAKANYHHHGLP
jgi:hypothetical protein